MNNYLSVCIWGNGPGRPCDNVYEINKMEFEEDVLRLFFCGGEECSIFYPQNIVLTKHGLKIEHADRITWKFYYYGEPASQDTLVTIEYVPTTDAHIRITTKGRIAGERIVLPKGMAFDSFGDIKTDCFGPLL